MYYGKVTKEVQYMGGQAVSNTVTYTESVKIEDDREALEAFTSLLEQFKRGEVTNPGIQVEVYPDSGKVNRIVKNWSVNV